MGPMAEPPEFLVKLLLGFCVLILGALAGVVLLELEKTWPFVLGFFASWLIGHILVEGYDWHEKRKMDRIKDDADRQKLEEVRKFSESLQAKQKAEELERQTRPPWQDHPYLRHTSYNQKNVSVTQNSDTSILPVVVGAMAGYAAGNHASHSSDSSCSSSDSGSCGGE